MAVGEKNAKLGLTWTMSNNSTSVRDIEAYVNTESGHELKTRRGSFVEGDQPVMSEDKTFTFLHWNVNGLFSNLRDNEFISFVHTFEIVCFVKTFMTLFQSNAFVDYFVFTKPAIKFSKQGRYAGGIVCLLRKEYVSYVRQLGVVCSNMLLLLINKDLFGVTKDILYMCVCST